MGDIVISKKLRRIANRFINRCVNWTKKGHRKVSYSQCGEDIIINFILTCLKIDKPTYMDIGAHHPFRFSNTALFYEAGCHGINIEPDPTYLNCSKNTAREM
jgi:hypothetical protein